MSEVHHVSSPEFKGLPRKVSIWQRDELLLILRSTDRCLPLEDIAKFVSFIEDVLPVNRIIRFPSVSSIDRQLQQMVKSELLEKKGNCYRITEKGTKLAEEAELSKENDKEIEKIWQTIRSSLASLPWSKLMWDSHLYNTLKQLKTE